jgi:hypothetical protein
VKELPPGWTCLGWQGRERVLLAQSPGGNRLAVANASTGEMKTIFP